MSGDLGGDLGNQLHDVGAGQPQSGKESGQTPAGLAHPVDAEAARRATHVDDGCKEAFDGLEGSLTCVNHLQELSTGICEEREG